MTQTPSTVVFVSLTGDEEIKVYDLDQSSGALRLRTTNPAHGPSGALFLHPTLDVLYDAHVESTTLASFRLDKTTGQVTLLNSVDTGIGIPAHSVTDSQGRYLLTAYYGGGGITVHRLGGRIHRRRGAARANRPQSPRRSYFARRSLRHRAARMSHQQDLSIPL